MSHTDDFKKYVGEHILPKARFEPHAYHDREGDCAEFLATPEPYHAERLDKWVTLYIGMDSNELVGAQVKRVSKLLEVARQYHTVECEIKRGRVKISILIKAAQMKSDDIPPPKAWDRYTELVNSADEANAEMELAGCA